MHDQYRAVSPLRRSRWVTRLGMVAGTPLAAMALVGTLGAAPAAAQGLSVEPATASVSTEWEAVHATEPEPGKDKDKDGPMDGDGCFEIDTVRQEAAGGGAFYAATSNGVAYVGDELSPLGTIDWDDLSDEGGDVPEGACAVSIDVGPTGEGSDVVIDVITTSETVHTITCDRTGSVITSCGTWVERDEPTPGATPGP
ncbi:hypothetical protein ACIQ7Q_03965 [Streptomyces sp. NPDC096176]|uniref:hypothetical protein n=1 Tax=Streptomyces sp. NPDC096176 TaxID=3366079 RepID=UPI0037F50893